MNITDLLIHVNETLDTTERTIMEDELRNLHGVIAPRFNNTKPHLLSVSYNPQEIDSLRLLNKVQTSGFHAQIVGM